jgi:hypothetical protein
MTIAMSVWMRYRGHSWAATAEMAAARTSRSTYCSCRDRAALIHRQVTAADTAGLWTLQISIFPQNRAGIALHHSAGFRTLGVRERIGQHHGVWRDTVLLERRRASDPDRVCQLSGSGTEEVVPTGSAEQDPLAQ